MSILRYFHTIRYMKPKQLYRQVLNKLHSPKVRTEVEYALREIRLSDWTETCRKNKNYIGNNQFNFLNESGEVKFNGIWQNKKKSRLWNYNLHYFDYINSGDFRARFAESTTLMDLWCQNNPLFSKPGWEPYPTSLRIVNWIKYYLEEARYNKKVLSNLYLQARFLRSNIEFHILGNHLFENIKALIFAGLFFKTGEAEKWLIFSIDLLREQLNEQVLEDGGHFERSAMYHVIFLEGILDIYNIIQACNYKNETSSFLVQKIKRMCEWLSDVISPDGTLPFIGDSVSRIAVKSEDVLAYAARLGIYGEQESPALPKYLDKSGYYCVRNKDMYLIANVGGVAPSYLPAHNHADTFTFELMLFGHKLITDTGASTYEPCDDRVYERSTAAHNTVLISNKNSSDTWKSFRIGKRAEVLNSALENDGNMFFAEHNGYSKILGYKCLHKRTWICEDKRVAVFDKLDSEHDVDFKVFFHLCPEIRIVPSNGTNEIEVKLNDKAAIFHIDPQLSFNIIDTYYSPEFGKKIPRKTICCTGKVSEESKRFENVISWK